MNARDSSRALAMGTSLHHESAQAQVTGVARYVDDLPEIAGTLHAAPILSPIAHGLLRRVDTAEALVMPGVRGIVLAADIPGDSVFAAFMHDEPIFAQDTVEFAGQVVGVVVADTVMQARQAALRVRLDIEELEPILDVRTALAKRSFVSDPVVVRRGDPDAKISAAPHHLSGTLEVGGQEHFYLEGQIAYAVPLEQAQWRIYSSTQAPSEVQHWVAHALGIERNAVTVECRRMGGGFGGKETQAGHLAVWSALAARKLQCPVKMRLDRDDDFTVTGKRHPFSYRYVAGFDEHGLILGLKVDLLSNCGFSADLSGPVAERAILHVDNAYYLGDVEIASYRCRTNTQSHTAFRGFGGPQGMIVTEKIIGDIAQELDLDPLDVRRRNLYGITERNITHYQMAVEDNILGPLVAALEEDCDYRHRREEIARWNKGSRVLKRGIALTPVKFGISFNITFFNQAGALVHVYLDGSVQVNHGGTEMGQGLHTKVLQVVADELGVPFERVRITASDTGKVPNTSPTAASAGTDLNARAAQKAAREIRDRLASHAARRMNCEAAQVSFAHGQVAGPAGQMSWNELVGEAYHARVQLWSDGFYSTPLIHYDKLSLTGRPFFYFAYGAACCEVAIDTLTGENRLLRVDILHDVGASINPALDIGQIEGGFVQGLGWLTTEQLVWNDKGKLTTHAPSTYKIPATGDVPAHLQVKLWPEPNREDNVGGSKAVGEPPLMLAISAYEALRNAIAAARPGRVDLVAPATPENIFRSLSAGRPASVRIGEPAQAWHPFES